MPHSNFEIKRILGQEEILKIWEMQSSANEMLIYFPDHKKWLENAIKDIQNGQKVAYGIFIPYLNPETLETFKKMIGAIILEKKEFSDTVELSNIFISEEFRNRKYGTNLCDKAEKYCAKNGFSTIIVRIPHASFSAINLFLKQGYVIFTNKSSRYRKNESFYEFVKKISPLYNGDPYDLEALSHWIIPNVYEFHDGFEKNNVIELDENLKMFEFIININKHYVDSGVDRNPKGLCFIFNKDLESKDEIKSILTKERLNAHFIFVLAPKMSRDVITYFNDNKIIALDLSIIYGEFNPIFAHKPIDLCSGDIAGIIVGIKKEFFENLIQKGDNFTYFKGVSVGKNLEVGKKIFFYCESPDNENEEGIRGYGHIDEVEIGSSAEIWSKYSDFSPVFSEDEYDGFVENKKSVMAIRVKNIEIVNPVRMVDINSWLGYKVDVDDFGHFYAGCRFDSKFMSHVARDNSKHTKIIHPDSPRIFISSPVNVLREERRKLKIMIEDELNCFCYISEKGGASSENRSQVLDELKKSHVLICLISDKLGTKTICGGKLMYPTEEEFECSIKLKKKTYLYLKNCDERDCDTEMFLEKYGEYEEGRKRQKFSSTDELLGFVKNDITRDIGIMYSKNTSCKNQTQ